MDIHDVVVVGGGPAGLAGAVALARSRRRVVVIDAGEPRNAPAAGAHNLLGREGVPPTELLATGRAEVASYGGEVRRARAVGAHREGEHLVVELDDGTTVTGRRLLVASGVVDELPDVPGLRERWGREVLHCPFCHGWEVRDQRLVVLGTGPASVHQALLFSRLSDDVVLLTHDASPVAQDLARLGAAGVRVVEGRAASLEGDPLDGVRLEGGDLLPAAAVVVATYVRAASPVLDALGLAPVPHPSGMGEHYPAEPTGATSLPGVAVAGNATDLMAQVGASAAAGTMAGALLHAGLMEAEIAARMPAAS